MVEVGHEVDGLLSCSVVVSSEVVGTVFSASDELLLMEELRVVLILTSSMTVGSKC